MSQSDDPEYWPLGDPFDGWVEGPPEGGFRWTEHGEYRLNDPQYRHLDWVGPWLIPCGKSHSAGWRDLLGDPRRAGIHRIFARLATDDREEVRLRGFLRFANRYGWLDARWTSPQRMQLVKAREGPGPFAVYGEPREAWDLATADVAALVRLWDLIRTNQTRQLGALFSLGGDPSVITVAPLYYVNGDISSEPPTDGSVGRQTTLYGSVACPEDGGWRAEDAIGPARAFLFQAINRGLKGEVSPELDSAVGTDLRYVPHTLNAAVFLHLAHEISGRSHGMVRCAYLGCRQEVYFPPRRTNQRYCTEQCRKLSKWHESYSPRVTKRYTPSDGNPDGNQTADVVDATRRGRRLETELLPRR
jgi:hypothetical protein